MPDTLTPVEHQVLRCALSTATHQEIAHRLHLSESTVQDVLHSIYRKLGISSQLELLLCVCSGAVKIVEPEGSAA